EFRRVLFRSNASLCAIASPALHEMLYGMLRLPPSRRRRFFEEYIRDTLILTVVVLPYDQTAAEWHAAERARLTGLGRTPPFEDGQIAAIAATNDLILVTANTVDFQHFQGLRVEDWRAGRR